MTTYGIYGPNSREFLTYGGLVLTHDNVEELMFLLPGSNPRPLPKSIRWEQTLPIRYHPEMASIKWPLDRKGFK